MDEALLLRFKSDDTINSKGFSAAYVIIDDHDNYDYSDSDSLSLDNMDDQDQDKNKMMMPNVNLDGMVIDQVTRASSLVRQGLRSPFVVNNFLACQCVIFLARLGDLLKFSS